MSDWALLAPGPSASTLAPLIPAGLLLGVIGNAFALVPRAEFLAATDAAWWQKHPEAFDFPAQRFGILVARGVTKVCMPGNVTVNSGVLALECAKRAGATRIKLYGFDMHGSHFFGQYTNGLTNTSEEKRRIHLRQYAQWAKANRCVEVINCTPGSALQCFHFEESQIHEYAG